MTVQMRPRMGPFVWVPNHDRGRMTGTAVYWYIKILFIIGVVWPLQLIWLAVKYLALGVLWLGRWISSEIEASQHRTT